MSCPSSSPPFSPSSSSRSPPLRRHLRHNFRQTSTWSSRLPWATPDLNRELQIVSAPGLHREPQIAVGSDLTRGALDRTGQRRTSPAELPSGVGSAGPQLPEDMSKDMSEEMSIEKSDNMSEKNARKNVRRYVRRNVRQECQKICLQKCQITCQKRMLE